MDIYQRRRLTAVGVLVTFISVIAIAAGNGGGDNTTSVSTDSGTSGASGTTGAQAALSKPDYIAQADSICGTANAAIAGETGVGTAVPDPGVEIRKRELNQLNSLAAPSKGAADLKSFLKAFKQLVSAASKRELANKRGDTTAQGDAQSAIDTATNQLISSGDAFGFKVCNSLDSIGSSSSSGTTGTGAASGTGTVDPGTASGGAVVPTTPATTTPVTPITPPANTTPPAGSGGDSGSSGGVTP